MFPNKKTISFFFLLSLSAYGIGAIAQQTTTTNKPKTAIIENQKRKQDSIKTEESLNNFSKKNRFTNLTHNIFFKPTNSKRTKQTEQNIMRTIPYANYSGKIIRRINIVTLEPFGNSIYDTIASPPDRFFIRAGNNLHIKTRKLTIKNLLLFKKNQPLDSLKMKESERLIRTQRYIREVIFRIEETVSNDSIDINIRVLDAWSIIPTATFSSSNFNVELTERNFLGMGHEWRNRYGQEFSTGKSAYGTRYFIPNIINTYINTTLDYNIDFKGNYIKSLDIERTFFSPLTRWAAGIYIDQQYQSDTLRDINRNYSFQSSKFTTQDLWGGHSFSIAKDKTEDNRTTNLITSARFLRISFQEAPDDAYNYLNNLSNQDFFLTGVGIASRKFVKDRYLFNYEIIEDVPIGRIYGLTTGYQKRDNTTSRYYLGGRIASGDYYRWGYLSVNAQYGAFYNGSQTEDGAFDLDINYFTSLMEWGNWKFRQFIRTNFTIGIDRHPLDNLSINNNFGIPGFNSTRVYGTKRILLTFQTQSYAPWEMVGFQFGPFISSTLGTLGNQQTGFSKAKIYSQFAMGFIIYNRYLVFESFQLSFAFFPSIPNVGNNILKTNSFRTTDFGAFSDFNFGKPYPIPYQ